MIMSFPWAHAVLWLGLLICLGLSVRTMLKSSYSIREALLFVPLCLLLGFFFAHLFHSLVRLDDVIYGSFASLFAFWNGGYMLFGGMAGVALAALLVARFSMRSSLELMDLLAPIGALCIVFIRLHEGLSFQNFGDYLEDGSFFARFPFAIYDADYEAWVEAVFMGGAAVSLLLAVFLHKTVSRQAGDRTLLFLGLYAAAQIVLESMRFDDFLRWGFIRSSQLISAVAIVFVLACYCRQAKGEHPRGRAAVWILYAICAALCLVLEFAVDGKIGFLTFLSPAACHTIMALICAVIAGCVLKMRSFAKHA